jgi:uncharacterized protein YndB with AHSA1/START domain
MRGGARSDDPREADVSRAGDVDGKGHLYSGRAGQPWGRDRARSPGARAMTDAVDESDVSAPPPADGFVRIETAVAIARPAAAVFDYATTPALWSTWHPATVEVSGVPLRPLHAGETIVERIAVAGRRDEATWTVVACAPPRRWEIATVTANGAAHIVYRIAATPEGCRFHRTLDFRSRRLPWRWLDGTLMRAVLSRQSARALANLKAVLER